MNRGNNNGIKGIYLNVIRASETLDPELQRRVHHVARASKDEDLGAALAKRADTLPEIDDDLGNWGSAKVQSAWFARPGRDMAAAVAKLTREKRITVLEVISALPDLPEEIYDLCAKRNAVRVALPLISNNSAKVKNRVAAATTLARGYSGMSYARQGALVGVLSSCDQEVVDAFVSASSDLTTTQRALGAVSSISAESLQHVYDLVVTRLRTIPKLHKQAVAEAQNSNNTYRTWNGPLYEINQVLREVEGVLRQAPLMAAKAEVNRDALFVELKALHDLFSGNKLNASDRDNLVYIERFSKQLDASNDLHPTSGPASEIRAASSEAQLLLLLDALIAKNQLDRPCGVAALTNPHATAIVADKALRAFGWGEVHKFLDARHRDVSLTAKAALMAHMYRTPDSDIEKFAAPSTPTELWTEIVGIHAKKLDKVTGMIPSELFHSKFAKIDVIPKIPLRVFSQPDLPGWLITGFAEYLTKELTTQAAWDGFEVLAPKHLGPVSQVVRAAKVTAKAQLAEGTES